VRGEPRPGGQRDNRCVIVMSRSADYSAPPGRARRHSTLHPTTTTKTTRTTRRPFDDLSDAVDHGSERIGDTVNDVGDRLPQPADDTWSWAATPSKTPETAPPTPSKASETWPTTPSTTSATNSASETVGTAIARTGRGLLSEGRASARRLAVYQHSSAVTPSLSRIKRLGGDQEACIDRFVPEQRRPKVRRAGSPGPDQALERGLHVQRAERAMPRERKCSAACSKPLRYVRSMSQAGVRTALSTGPWRQRARWALRLVTPWGIEWLLFTRRSSRAVRGVEAKVVREAPPAHTRVEQAIGFLVDRGLDEHAVREGSMPEGSFDYTAELISDRLPRDRPVRALHVGNFVGVSLCFFSWLVRERHPGSVVVSVDPNTTHRGVEDPQAHVLALLGHFGLLDANLIVPGYTLEQTIGEAGSETEADHLEGLACEHVLAGLKRLCGQRFDLVLLDGNHEQSHLARELTALEGLLAENAIVVFDDVTEWEGVVEVFRQALRDERFVELGQDGRVGILQVRGAGGAGVAGER